MSVWMMSFLTWIWTILKDHFTEGDMIFAFLGRAKKTETHYHGPVYHGPVIMVADEAAAVRVVKETSPAIDQNIDPAPERPVESILENSHEN
jgi:hypothetical protein